MANGMAALFVGASGLRSAQESINTTAHNLANVGTKGYTRQQITTADTGYINIGSTYTGNLKSGLGVSISEIRRVRDEFLDASYREENGRTAFYESQYEAVEEIENLFDEMEGVTLDKCLDNLWSSINEVAKNPGSTVTRTELVQMASEFLSRATSIYDGLIKYQRMVNVKISDMVNRINELGSTIQDLNNRISAIELAGESANDLRDQRDNALDELGTYVKIKYEEDKTRKVNITIEGVPFLQGNTLYTMATREIDGSDMLVPTWPILDGRDVFMLNEEFSALSNNDIGELKGLLIARGSLAGASYEDVPVKPDRDNFENEDEYLAEYDEYEKKSERYNKYIGNSVILSTMASLDKLVNGIVDMTNKVLCPETTAAADIYDKDGNLVAKAGDAILDMEKTSYGMDGETVGVELFSRKFTDRYIAYELEDGSKVYVRNDLNLFGNPSKYTLGNLEINDTVLQDYQKIPLGTKDLGEDIKKAEELLNVWDVQFAALNPSKYAKENFRGFYNSLVSEIANTGEVLHNMTQYQQSMTDEIQAKRSEKGDVYSDEELKNMIMFQNAYNASSRYINVVNEMIEHVITALGS